MRHKDASLAGRTYRGCCRGVVQGTSKGNNITRPSARRENHKCYTDYRVGNLFHRP